MTELEKKLTNALLMIRDHINKPEVIASIIDKNIGTDKDLMLDNLTGEDTTPEAKTEAEQQNIVAPEDLKEGDHIIDASGTEHIVLGHSAGNLILETIDGKRSEVPYSVIEKELAGGTAYISSTNITIPKEEKHFGEEQAAGLAEILNGLREGPNDNRW